MRPGSQGKLLGICLLGVVSLVVSVRHLFLGDLFSCLLLSSLVVVSVLGYLLGSPFFFCCYICCVITVVFGSFVLVVLCVFLLGFDAGKTGFPYFFLLLYLVFVVFICFEYTELLPGWLTSEALLTRC